MTNEAESLESQIDRVMDSLDGLLADLRGIKEGVFKPEMGVSDAAIGCAFLDRLVDMADGKSDPNAWFNFLREALEESVARWAAEEAAIVALEQARRLGRRRVS